MLNWNTDAKTFCDHKSLPAELKFTKFLTNFLRKSYVLGYIGTIQKPCTIFFQQQKNYFAKEAF